MEKSELLKLMKITANANPSAPTAYTWGDQALSYEALDATLRKELNELAGDYRLYRRNKNLIFELIEETIDEVLPTRVVAQYERFANVKTFNQGDRPLFRRPTGSRNRAKQFITRVGLAGVYEVFKLSPAEEVFEVPTSAIGGAAQIGFEEFLDGRITFADVFNVILDGMDELIYREVGEALKAGINQLPPANRVAAAGFDEAEFDRLLSVASAYGTPVIYCTEEFASKMLPRDAWRYTEGMKEALWNNGRLPNYKRWQVVILEQGFEDGTNQRKVIDPGYCWIIPSNGKPVNIAFEGDTLMREVEANQDWSREIQVYKKVGVMAMFANDICCYVDTSLAGEMDKWHFGAADVQNTVMVSNIASAAGSPASEVTVTLSGTPEVKVADGSKVAATVSGSMTTTTTVSGEVTTNSAGA